MSIEKNPGIQNVEKCSVERRLCGAGDRVAAVAGRRPAHAAHAGALVNSCPHRVIDILVHRVPLAKIYVLRKEREDENLGIKLLQDCTVSSVAPASAAARAAVPRGWSLTEVNHTPLNLIKCVRYIKLLQDCTVSSVAPASAAARAAVPRGWSLTEVNHTPLNLIKGGQEDLNRLSAGCREVTLLLQPAPFVRKIRAVIKANKH
ncbi:hypothetical protein JYU34_007969 [Plutella xylostella]|uniref:PDZ domain-containing protein n=1 Tax=Plutella xylostella TaxID=51655 RepID=A0ABQ7QNJ3_PLUXY|nr:hypothetical protein JYU34_007969 [Plutella xylostella]